MPLILNIDTATDFASVCLSQNGALLSEKYSTDQKNHASFVQPAIDELLKQTGVDLQQLDAIGVTAGPGSYTGLRVGLSTAKGLCYALKKPLICCNTLEVMATAAIEHIKGNTAGMLFAPMIDARRMEVFTAVYDDKCNVVMEPSAMILSEDSFLSFLGTKKIVFSGNGSKKFSGVINSDNLLFVDIQHSSRHLFLHAEKGYQEQNFADIAYCEPLYLKEFYSITH